MPTLEWIGKNKVINHHLDVPYRVLDHQYTYTENGIADDESENKIRTCIQKRFNKVVKWEIIIMFSAEAVRIS